MVNHASFGTPQRELSVARAFDLDQKSPGGPGLRVVVGLCSESSLGQVEARVTLPTVRRRELQYCCSDVPAFSAFNLRRLVLPGPQATYTQLAPLPSRPAPSPILLQVFPFRSTVVGIIRLFSPRRITSSHTSYPLPFLRPVSIPCAGCFPPPVATGQTHFSHIIPILRPLHLSFSCLPT